MDPYLQRLANQLPYQIAKEHADSLLGKIWEKIGLTIKKTSWKLVNLLSDSKEKFGKFCKIVFNKYKGLIKQIDKVTDNKVKLTLINWKKVLVKYSPLLNKIKKFTKLFKFR
jgi:hypothetical protein